MPSLPTASTATNVERGVLGERACVKARSRSRERHSFRRPPGRYIGGGAGGDSKLQPNISLTSGVSCLERHAGGGRKQREGGLCMVVAPAGLLIHASIPRPAASGKAAVSQGAKSGGRGFFSLSVSPFGGGGRGRRWLVWLAECDACTPTCLGQQSLPPLSARAPHASPARLARERRLRAAWRSCHAAATAGASPSEERSARAPADLYFDRRKPRSCGATPEHKRSRFPGGQASGLLRAG